MRIHVDQARCRGHAQCNATAPEVYELDELGYTALDGEIEVAAELAEGARRGALVCPEQVITVFDE